MDLINFFQLFAGGSLWTSSGNPSEDPGGGKRFRRTYFRVYSGRLPFNFTPVFIYLKKHLPVIKLVALEAERWIRNGLFWIR